MPIAYVRRKSRTPRTFHCTTWHSSWKCVASLASCLSVKYMCPKVIPAQLVCAIDSNSGSGNSETGGKGVLSTETDRVSLNTLAGHALASPAYPRVEAG